MSSFTSAQDFFFQTANQKNLNKLKNPMSPEPFVSRAKVLSAERGEKGSGDENGFACATCVRKSLTRPSG